MFAEGEVPGVTANASLKLSTGWALNRCFAWTCGTAAVRAQGGGGYHYVEHHSVHLFATLWDSPLRAAPAKRPLGCPI